MDHDPALLESSDGIEGRPLSQARRRSAFAVISWSLYDLANTVFYLLVVTIYLPKHLEALSGAERTISYAMVPAMLLAGALSPGFGAWLDRSGRARRATLWFTGACCVTTAVLYLLSSPVAICFAFAIGLFCYQMASVSYQSLLPVVARPESVGRVSGLGVALGYLGNVVALGAVAAFGLEEKFGIAPIFLLAALAFAVFTVPLARWVPERPIEEQPTPGLRELFAELRGTMTILRRNRRNIALWSFLVGNFLVCDVINTVLVQVARYSEHESGLALSNAGRTKLLIAINVTAVVCGVLLGMLADRWGGKRVTILSGILLGLAFSVPEFLIGGATARATVLVACGGAGIAGVWTASRLWLLRTVPEERSAEAFGLYGLTLKISQTTLLPFTWLVDRTGDYGVSIAVLLAVLTVGLGIWIRSPAERFP